MNNERWQQSFCWPVRVYYEDTDCGGVVYHARYLYFLERARTEFLRHAGFSQGQLATEHDLLFAVRHLHIDYLRPARYDDQLTVITRVHRGGPASLDFIQEICRQQVSVTAAVECICKATVNIVCLTHQGLRPRRLPKDILKEILA